MNQRELPAQLRIGKKPMESDSRGRSYMKYLINEKSVAKYMSLIREIPGSIVTSAGGSLSAFMETVSTC